LHLVGILFPHINDDARSKSHQTGPYLTLTAWVWSLTSALMLSRNH